MTEKIIAENLEWLGKSLNDFYVRWYVLSRFSECTDDYLRYYVLCTLGRDGIVTLCSLLDKSTQNGFYPIVKKDSRLLEEYNDVCEGLDDIASGCVHKNLKEFRNSMVHFSNAYCGESDSHLWSVVTIGIELVDNLYIECCSFYGVEQSIDRAALADLKKRCEHLF